MFYIFVANIHTMNPFHITGYYGASTFCDRDIETEKLINAIDNQRNVTLTSLRKMGKTGLIYHVLERLKKKKGYTVFYIDIYHTTNFSDFLDKLGSEIINKEESFSAKARKLLRKFLTALSPTLTYDPLTGTPSLSFNFNNKVREEQTLVDILNFLSAYGSNKPIVIAIDEFQQITKYPEKNIEALLRGSIQNLKNVNFIFSGSDLSMMSAIFNNTKRPFYQSTQMMHLDKIPEKEYAKFIKKHLKAGGINMSNNLIKYVLEETQRHTYYVQYFSNRIYSSGYKDIDMSTLNIIYAGILEETETYYSSYKDLISPHQWMVLIALSNENGISGVTSGEFIRTYNLSNPSTVRRAIKSLLGKQFIYKKESGYYIYDVFFGKWLSLQKY